MELVDEAHRHQEETRAGVDLGTDPALEVGELDRHLAALPFARLGVLPLDLRVEQPVVVPLVAEVEDRAQEVELVLPAGVDAVVALRGEALVEHLAVAADRQPLLDGVDLGRRRTEAGGAAARRGSCRRALAEPHLLELGGQDIDPPRKLGDVAPAPPSACAAPRRPLAPRRACSAAIAALSSATSAARRSSCSSFVEVPGEVLGEVLAGGGDCAKETLANASPTASASALAFHPPAGDFPCMD